MKGFIFSAVFAAAFTTQALASTLSPLQGRLRGGGEWKQPDGKKSYWSGEMTLVNSEDGKTIEVSETIVMNVNGLQEKKHSFIFKEIGNDFYDIYEKDANGKEVKTGDAYCFESICHLHEYHNGNAMEETWQIENGNLYKVGSGHFKSGEKMSKVAWKGKLLTLGY